MVIALSHSDPLRHEAAPASSSIYNVGPVPKRVKIGAGASISRILSSTTCREPCALMGWTQT
jgi:hypothetical protein